MTSFWDDPDPTQSEANGFRERAVGNISSEVDSEAFTFLPATVSEAQAVWERGDIPMASDVNAGEVVILVGSTWNPSMTWTVADCTKVSGTATIGEVIPVKRQTQLGSNGYYDVGIFLIPITGSGSLTLRLTVDELGNNFYFFLAACAFATAGTEFTVESTNGGGADLPGSVNPFNTGDCTSSDKALFITGITYGFGDDAATLTVAGYTPIAVHTEDDGQIVGGAMFHIVAAATTEQASWLYSRSNWGAGVVAALAVIRATSSAERSVAKV